MARQSFAYIVDFRVIAGGGPEDECLLYNLANFKKGGTLVEAFTKGGGTKQVCWQAIGVLIIVW